MKIGAKVVAPGRYLVFQMGEVAVPRELFRAPGEGDRGAVREPARRRDREERGVALPLLVERAQDRVALACRLHQARDAIAALQPRRPDLCWFSETADLKEAKALLIQLA